MKTSEIRKLFLEFFKNKGHIIKPSDSLIPSNDPTLLFTSAGMVQFKPMYVTEGKIEFTRAVTCQKCFRTDDLERVGQTSRHHTFFEMLGNFSFGDYFKKEAIEWAWEFVNLVLKLPKDSLWISVYKEDNEAFDIWNKHLAIPESKIVKLDKKDNFWGPVSRAGGPCGSCSEIYIDFGPSSGCGHKNCRPGCDCDRFDEFWNLVFPSYNADSSGNLHPLAKRGVDTGMGLERMASILQNVNNIFDIDIIKPIIVEVANLTEVRHKEDAKKDVQIKIITDHIRAITFLIGDGVFPLNEGRGYVLRRMIRRAVRFGKLLGIEKPFLYKLVGHVADMMKDTYPELNERRTNISQIVGQEEERFHETLVQGMNILNELMEKYKEEIPAEEAFKLYDTFGFPLDLTKEIVGEKGIKVDEDVFKKLLEEQQEKARLSWKGTGDKEVSSMLNQFSKTEFVGYETFEIESKVVGILKGNVLVKESATNEEVSLIFDKTPFYGESGGQTGDTGLIKKDGFEGFVLVAEKYLQKIIVHMVKIKEGKIKIGDRVKAVVDIERRKSIMRHHTATHLLQHSLREVLGGNVTQSGSYVESDYFRFDFTHYKALTKTELDKVEQIINEKIIQNLPVLIKEMKIEEAKKTGALAFFGEKYGELVRVVAIGDISLELCGGTHVKNTGEIGLVKIISESSAASGIRRIEARAGIGSYKMIREQEKILKDISAVLNIKYKEIPDRIEKMIETIKSLEKEVDRLKRGEGLFKVDEILKDVQQIKNINVVIKSIDNLDLGLLRDIGDKIKDKLKTCCVVLFTTKDNKLSYICMITKDLLEKINASFIIKEIAKIIGGSGGGRVDLAEGGAKSVNDLSKVLKETENIIKKMIG
ncbi:MAG: alanine--tRNA ligase [Candidatus Firestonebacteria bacterium]